MAEAEGVADAEAEPVALADEDAEPVADALAEAKADADADGEPELVALAEGLALVDAAEVAEAEGVADADAEPVALADEDAEPVADALAEARAEVDADGDAERVALAGTGRHGSAHDARRDPAPVVAASLSAQTPATSGRLTQSRHDASLQWKRSRPLVPTTGCTTNEGPPAPRTHEPAATSTKETSEPAQPGSS